jgi:hypothetical protein
VDGQQIQGTLIEAFSFGTVGSFENFAVFGTKAVSAGTHTIRFRAGNNPNVMSFQDTTINVGGIALGNS